MGQWGLKASRGTDGPSYEELVETEGRPRLRMWLERLHAERMLEAAVVYGYYPVVSEGDDLVLLEEPRSTPASATASRSRASATAGTSASPTSSGRASPARPTCWGSSS